MKSQFELNFFTIQKAADYLKMSTVSLWKLRKANVLTSTNNSAHLISKASVDEVKEFFDQYKKKFGQKPTVVITIDYFERAKHESKKPH